MAKYCEYCGLSLAPEDRICPNCGAPAPEAEQSPDKRPGIPGTIAELKAFARAHGMPLEQMRFFLGRNESSPRAFGIYQDRAGDFIVYKNKNDGTRAIRYRGPDEAAAVREIYRKLQDEVTLRRGGGRTVYPTASSPSVRSQGKRGLNLSVVILIVIGALVLFFSSRFSKEPNRGYYLYDDVYYYYQDSDWFYYSRSMENWVAAGEVDEPLQKNPNKYFSSQNYLSDYDVESFSSSPYYEGDDADWDSNDNAWDYDYDSWDAGDTDWDSDW